MKNITAWIIVIVAALAACWFWRSHTDENATPQRSLITTAIYSCDRGKNINAAYYKGPEAPASKPGEPPQPTGSVDVSIDGGAKVTLAQTISADGARYANADESLVFWNKGNQALIMRNNQMDLNYKNCTEVQPANSGV